MLFSYQYVPSDIENFQAWLDHLVKEVWCEAADEFTLELLHPSLRQVVESIYSIEKKTPRGKIKDWLYGPITTIYDFFRNALSTDQRRQVAVWYDNNNDIEKLCSCNMSNLPGTYDDVASIHSDLAKHLSTFCQSLFTDVIGLKAVTKKIGDLDSHYDAFVKANAAGKCPYCGYNDIKGERHTRREAYDHFLPKSVYPFSSVNFRNLAPMCHECNSSYKQQKDPIRCKKTGMRRKAFYSYSSTPPQIDVVVSLMTDDVTRLTPENIDIEFRSPGRDQEVESWSDLFGIVERYRGKCCAENDGKAWLQQVVEESQNGEFTSDQLIALIDRAAGRKPFDSANFLKCSFLHACKASGLLR